MQNYPKRSTIVKKQIIHFTQNKFYIVISEMFPIQPKIWNAN